MEASLGFLQNHDLSALLPSGSLPELQDIMHKVDIMVNNKKDEWEAELQELIDERNHETAQMHKQLTTLHKQLQEEQAALRTITDELTNERLQCRHYKKMMRAASKAASSTTATTKGHKDIEVEVGRLTDRIKEHQRRSEQERGQHLKQLASERAQRKSLAEQLSKAKAQLQHAQAQLENARSQEAELNQLRPLRMLVEGKGGGGGGGEPQDGTTGVGARSQNQKLHGEIARLNELLQAKEKAFQALEWQDIGVGSLKQELEKTLGALHGARAQEERLREDGRRKDQELKRLEADVNKLVEEVVWTKEMSSREAEETRKKLLGDLGQRDRTIAALKSKRGGGGTNRQLHGDEDDVHLQLENLTMENQHLNKQSSSLEHENAHLRRDLTDVQALLEICQDNYDSALLGQAVRAAAAGAGRQPPPSSSQDHVFNHRQKEMQEMAATPRYEEEEEIQDDLPKASSPSHPRGGPRSSNAILARAVELPSATVPAADLLPEGEEGFFRSEDASLYPPPTREDRHGEGPPPASLPASMVSRFLDEEDVCSEELKQRLDTHIQILKRGQQHQDDHHPGEQEKTQRTVRTGGQREDHYQIPEHEDHYQIPTAT